MECCLTGYWKYLSAFSCISHVFAQQTDGLVLNLTTVDNIFLINSSEMFTDGIFQCM